jgi:hypothetical protein
VYFIEQGAYISEQFDWGKVTGATSRVCFLSFVLLFPAVHFLNRYFRNGLRPPSARYLSGKAYWLHALLSWGAVCLLIAYGLVNGFALTLDVDRFSYWEDDLLSQFVRKLTFLIPIFSFMIFCFALYKKKIYIFQLAFFAAILFLYGDKFSGLLDMLLYSLMGFGVHVYAGRGFMPSLRQIFLAIQLPVLSLVLLGGYGYLVWHDTVIEDLLAVVLSRILVLQGHTYFGTDAALLSQGPVFSLIDIFRQSGVDGPHGIRELMYVVAPADFATAMTDLGIRFSQGGVALPVYKLGFILGAVFLLFFGIFLWLFFRVLFLFSAAGNYIGLFLSLIFFNSGVVNSVLMGDYYYLFRAPSVVFYAYLIGHSALWWFQQWLCRRVT